MKTYLTYGAAMAIAGALLLMLLYLLGLHSDPAKLGTAQIVGVCCGVAIGAVCITLGTKARRAEVPPSEEFGYGQALLAGFMITLFASLFGIITTFIYAKFINPEFADVIVQAQTQKLEAQGVSGAQLEGMEKGIRFMMSPPLQAVIGLINGLIGGTIIALVTSAFLRRPAEAEAPPAVPS